MFAAMFAVRIAIIMNAYTKIVAFRAMIVKLARIKRRVAFAQAGNVHAILARRAFHGTILTSIWS